MPGQSRSHGSGAPRRQPNPLRLATPSPLSEAGDVRRATPVDLPFVVALQKRDHEALGFIPRAALAEKIERDQLLLVRENGDPAGFLHHGSLAVPEVRIFQAAIQ